MNTDIYCLFFDKARSCHENPKPVVAENGLTLESNTKHTLGQPGNNVNAGIEPSNSLELFNKSIPSTKDPGIRFSLDTNGNIQRFFSDGNGAFHWSGSIGNTSSPLTIDQLRQGGFSKDIRALGVK